MKPNPLLLCLEGLYAAKDLLEDPQNDEKFKTFLVGLEKLEKIGGRASFGELRVISGGVHLNIILPLLVTQEYKAVAYYKSLLGPVPENVIAEAYFEAIGREFSLKIIEGPSWEKYWQMHGGYSNEALYEKLFFNIAERGKA